MQTGNTKSCGCFKQRRDQTGKNNPNYVHGKCCGKDTKVIDELKEKCRKEANYKCQECGKIQEQNIGETNEILSVHHIDGNDTNNNPKNLKVLCKSCHQKIKSVNQ